MTFFRNVVWFCKGLKEYTKSGFETASKKFNPSDLDVDCHGLSYMITGANSGLGKQTALEIAKKGGTVHMVCRNPKYAEEAQKEIQDVSNSDKIHVHILDMSDPKAVFKFANGFDEPLNVLINNAGCMVNERTLTEEGLEKNFATNTLGTHILTENLISKLQKTSPDQKPRVVIVSSGGMLTQKLDLSDLNSEKGSFDGTMVYAQQKRQQVIMTEQYAEQHPDIFWASMHPGWADTPAVRTSMPDFHAKMKDKLRTVEQGADTIVWLACSKVALENTNGLFYQDRQAVSTHLPMAWSRSSPEECKQFMEKLKQIAFDAQGNK